MWDVGLGVWMVYGFLSHGGGCISESQGGTDDETMPEWHVNM